MIKKNILYYIFIYIPSVIRRNPDNSGELIFGTLEYLYYEIPSNFIAKYSRVFITTKSRIL